MFYLRILFITLTMIFLTLYTNCKKESSDLPAIVFPIKPGIDVLLTQNMQLILGKQVGLITNPTGVTSDFRSTIDALHECPEVTLTALFGPEHGIRGDHQGGHTVHQNIDDRTGAPVYSLYYNGRPQKLSPEMLHNVDVLLFDIQDIGSRAYTYIYTMSLAMEAAREANIPFIVLDRPNPLGGNRVEGNVLDPKFKSDVGRYSIPYIYGMTIGELAKLFNEEYGIGCNLTVIPMEGWRREMNYEQTELPWIPTSIHVPHADTPFFIATTGCLGELGTVSEGVGYTSPFEIIGAPWVNGIELSAELNSRSLAGVFFRPIFYKPFYYRFVNENCYGVQIHILNKDLYSPSKTQIHIIHALQKLYSQQNLFNTTRIKSFDNAYGTDQIRLAILNGTQAETIIKTWEHELTKFKLTRDKYLIYR